MQLATLESRVDDIVSELAQFNGYRTVWLSERGELFHAEPEDMLELSGFIYVTTMFKPTREQLMTAALRLVPVELDEPVRLAMAGWKAPALEPTLATAI